MIKIKIKFLACLILILASAVYAEDYSRYSSLNIRTNFSSGINIKYDSGGSIDYVNADISLFPVANNMQEIFGIDVTTNPKAKVTKGDIIGIRWENVNENQLAYFITSNVNINDNILKIGHQVGFPIQGLNYDYFKYTKATEFIDLNDEIINKANELASGEDDLYKVAFKIAEWVRKNVNYTLDTLTEKAVQKSSWVMDHKEGVCDEITNLFISMMRSQGIPARFVSGMVYTNVLDDFGAHGWAEVYFPDHGWVPFDVTFGQYGWIDTSHVVLKYSLDSGESSVDYSWRSKNVELNAEELIVNSHVIDKGSELTPKVKIEVNVLKNDVGENSYVPVEVAIENLQDYYLSDMIYVTKALELTEDNKKEVLLKPREIKKLFWIAKVPSLKAGYKYEAVFEVKDNFNSVYSTIINYAYNDKTFSFKQANQIISESQEAEEKIALDTELKCVLDKEYYYSGEIAKIRCSASPSEGINICLMNECREAGNANFDFNVASSGRIVIAAKKDNRARYAYLNLKAIEIPNLTVKEVKPSRLDYSKEINLTIVLDSDYLAKNVLINIDKTGVLKLDNLVGEKEIGINLDGISLLNGLEFDIKYFDEIGKEYSKKQVFDIKVEKVPFFVRIRGLFLKWFNMI